MSFIKFFSSEVKSMSRTLEQSGDRIKGASKEMSRTDSSKIGHTELESACTEFADSWDYGLGQLSKVTKGVSKYANKAADAFADVDEKLYSELAKAQKKSKD